MATLFKKYPVSLAEKNPFKTRELPIETLRICCVLLFEFAGHGTICPQRFQNWYGPCQKFWSLIVQDQMGEWNLWIPLAREVIRKSFPEKMNSMVLMQPFLLVHDLLSAHLAKFQIIKGESTKNFSAVQFSRTYFLWRLVWFRWRLQN